jgi:hypothetical protein
MIRWPGRRVPIASILCAVLASCASTQARLELPAPTERELALAANARLHVEKLAGEIGPRAHSDRDAVALAVRYISSALARAGLEVRQQGFESGGETSINVEGRTPSGRKERTLIVGAHYDTERASPGANDNASGVAAMIELARLIGQRELGRCSYRFVAFAREEDGLLGSRAYARDLVEAGTEVRAMLSIDSLGYYSDALGSQSLVPGARRGSRRANFVTFASDLASQPAMQAAASGFARLARCRCSSWRSAPRSRRTSCAPTMQCSGRTTCRRFSSPTPDRSATRPTTDRPTRPTDTPDRLDFERLGRAIAGLEVALLTLEREVCGTDAPSPESRDRTNTR